jgi:predicted Fe-Mo cluster-binding NifX family protein
MSEKVLITILGDNVAPRFDMTTEVLILRLRDGGEITDERTMVLHQSSPEDLCQLIVSEHVDTVVCGGIEDEYYQYLTWKKLQVFDSVVGPYSEVLKRLRNNSLESGLILFQRSGRSVDAI